MLGLVFAALAEEFVGRLEGRWWPGSGPDVPYGEQRAHFGVVLLGESGDARVIAEAWDPDAFPSTELAACMGGVVALSGVEVPVTNHYIARGIANARLLACVPAPAQPPAPFGNSLSVHGELRRTWGYTRDGARVLGFQVETDTGAVLVRSGDRSLDEALLRFLMACGEREVSVTGVVTAVEARGLGPGWRLVAPVLPASCTNPSYPMRDGVSVPLPPSWLEPTPQNVQ
ncbi:MAG: hypothetical protein FJ102_02460 [Deltaproteobacteria bacterium]|nr:hypothetical protein [Deltaproteobacteria bacterium]